MSVQSSNTTVQIGDISGKDEARKFITPEIVMRNTGSLKRQIKGVFGKLQEKGKLKIKKSEDY